MKSLPEKFGERVKHLRKLRGLSQEKLAEMASLHSTYIGGIERGERNVSIKNIGKIAEALKVSLEELFKEL
jgi:XRE family transcriptional regulator, regulator of sulfur utilization